MTDSCSESATEEGEDMNALGHNGSVDLKYMASNGGNNGQLTTCSNCQASYSGEKTWHNARAWAIEQKLALMAGKAAFDLEGYIFRKVLPPTDVRPHIFPRTIDEMQSYILNCSLEDEQDDLRIAQAKWNELKEQLNWTVIHEQVLTSAKQSYLMIKPPADMIKDINAKRRNIDDLVRAFRTSLPIHLRPAGDEIVQMMAELNLI